MGLDVVAEAAATQEHAVEAIKPNAKYLSFATVVKECFLREGLHLAAQRLIYLNLFAPFCSLA